MIAKLFESGINGGRKLLNNKVLLDRKILSWALYDWANSAFATTVVAGFFPVFFKSYWAQGLSAQQSTWYLGLSNSLSSLSLAAIAPLLGNLADQGRCKKNFLIMFACLGIIATAMMFFIRQGDYLWACILFAFASLGWAGSNVFYDGLIVDVTNSRLYHLVSGYGYAMGYLGGGLLFAINVAMTLSPATFGLNNKVQAVQVSFLMVAAWWFLFSLPMLKMVKETGSTSPLSLKQSWKGFFSTIHSMRSHKNLLLFFLAYLFYIDGVNTTIKMAVDYGMALGFETSDLMTALLMVQFIGFPAALGFGVLGQKLGAKPSIYLAIAVYVAVVIGGYFMQTSSHFYIMAAAIGCVQGGIQSLSRSYYAQMIPKEKAGEFFGIFNMMGKFSAILGPLAIGFVSTTTQNSRLSILVLLIFFGLGALLLSLVNKESFSVEENQQSLS